MRKYLLVSDSHEKLKPKVCSNTDAGFDDHVPIIGSSADRIPKGIEVDENRIYFYCPVGSNEALEINRLLRRLDVEMKYLSDRLGCESVPIHLHVHSSGGSIFAGLSISDSIKKCETDVYTYVDGSAASAATLISTSGKMRFMSKNSFMLLHQPQLEWSGKLDEFRDEIKNQNSLYEKLSSIYIENSNMKNDELDELLKHELWLDANRCLELGLVDEII
jgi:ATP-dependent protease ClpP protease subunit